jgi:hypothetical protein
LITSAEVAACKFHHFILKGARMATSKKLKTTKVTKIKAVTKGAAKPRLKTLLINKRAILAYDSKNKSYKLDKYSYDHLMGNVVGLIQTSDRSTLGVPFEIEDIVLQVKYRCGKNVKDMRLMVDGSHKNAWKRPKDHSSKLSTLR